MNEAEILGLIRYTKETAPRFNMKPESCFRSWHKALGEFSREEGLDAVDFVVMNSAGRFDINYLSEIKNRCLHFRYQLRQRHNSSISDSQLHGADRSFNGVPGATRADQIAFVTGEQASKHWIAGERDNDFFNATLLSAQRCGFEFDGVDYSQVTVSEGYGDFFAPLRRMAQNNESF